MKSLERIWIIIQGISFARSCINWQRPSTSKKKKERRGERNLSKIRCCMKRNEFHPCISRTYLRSTLYLFQINLNGYSERLSYINCGVGGSPFISFIVISDRQYRRPTGFVKRKKKQQQQPPLPPFTRSLIFSTRFRAEYLLDDPTKCFISARGVSILAKLRAGDVGN